MNRILNPVETSASGKFKLGLCAAACAALLSACAQTLPDDVLVIKEQGSFTAGGSTKAYGSGEFSEEHFLDPAGQSAYGDHAYVLYQIPYEAKAYPIVFQHGGAQSKRTWESTPDGRDGFQNLFLKAGYPVYLIDQPRMASASLSLEADDGSNPYAQNPLYADHALFNLCRLGMFPDLFEGSQFPQGAYALDQFERSWTPYAGKLDDDVSAKALSALFDQIGDAVLMTHSMGGTVGWRTPFLTDHVKAIVSIEPGGSPFLFPQGQMPKLKQARYAAVSTMAKEVSMEDFKKLTEIPILLIYGDYIEIDGDENTPVGVDKWGTELDTALKFVECINENGGRASLISLPDLGIYGNSHFLMSELNNAQIAKIIEDWLADQGM